MRRHLLALTACCLLSPSAPANAPERAEPSDIPELLDTAVDKLVAEEGRWAYTRITRKYDRHDRLERLDVEQYDPSRPRGQQWDLTYRNGAPPSPEDEEEWLRKRRREMHRRDRPLIAFVDLPEAALLEETLTHAVYLVPVQPNASKRLPAGNFYVVAQVNKEREEFDHLALRTHESFRVAGGLAEIQSVEADVRFAVVDEDHPAQPIHASAIGAGRVAWLFPAGGRIEFAWSDFRRVGSD